MLHVHRMVLASSILALATAPAVAQMKTYLVSPTSAGKATQTFSFTSVTSVKNIVGQSQNVTGQIRFDPAKRTGSGKLSIDIKSVDSGMPVLNQTMWTPEWLDAAKYPTASFETTRVRWRTGDEYDVTGKLGFRGVTKVMTIPVTVRRLKAGDATRAAGFKGDAVHLKTTFEVRIADHGVKIPERSIGTVADVITISLSVFGAAE